MATFKFLVLPHQRKEDGTYNVKIRITQKGKSKYIKTSHNVSASDIIKKKDNGKEKIKIKNQAVIDLMEEMILGFKKKLTSAGVEAEHWDVDRIVEYLTTEEKNFSLNFISYGRKIADDLEQDGRLGTAKNYRIAINALVRFIGKEELDINLITASFMRKYRSWKQEKEKNAYLIEIEDILPSYSLSCINRNRLRKERKGGSSVTKSFEKR